VSDKEQIAHFANELDAIVDRFRSEYDITYAAVVGTLQMKIHNLCNEAATKGDE
jgi:hypothetical protein